MLLLRILCGLFLCGLMAAGRTLEIHPPNLKMAGAGATQRLIASISDPGTATSTDVTATCAFQSMNPAKATVDGAVVTAKAPGEAQIRATCQGLTAHRPVTIVPGGGEVQVTFTGHILSILTTKGCNSSACHGSPAGQAGFKLSLYGSDPRADVEMILRDRDGRRVNPSDPADSLFLKKPSFQTPHGGGQLMTQQSDEYRTMLEWLRQGSPFGASAASLQSLEIYPADRILSGSGVRQPVVVLGRLSDGTTRDMTTQVRFSVADQAVISPVEEYAVTARKPGLTVVLARAMGLTAAAQFLVTEQAPGSAYPEVRPHNLIDRHVYPKLRAVHIQPYPLTDDRAFVRRVYLDAIGLLPEPAEVEQFVSSQHSDKRARLINNLLDRPEYATHWLTKFEDWFRNSQYYSQGRTNASYKRWLHELIRDDRPYDQAVREMLTATGDTTVRPAGNFWHPAIDFMLKKFEVNKAVPTITRLFLGKRVECAECHNHPLENLTQDDFYGMAAFLARTQVKHGYGQYRRIWYNTRTGETIHPVTQQVVKPRFLDGTEPDLTNDQDRREVLAEWITRDQKMQFARATVNRVWAEYFTVGIVDPPDDFRSTNVARYPALLDALAEQFIENGYRFKPLHRLILNSRVYQTASHSLDRPGGESPLETLLYARYEPRKLPAEVLMDAVSQVTDVPFSFPGYPAGTSPKELVASIGAPYFLTIFGFPRRDIMEQREGGPSLAQALHLMNSDAIREKVSGENSILTELLSEHSEDRQVATALYVRAFSKPPSDSQWNTLAKYLEDEREAGRTRRRAFENVLWAILNSKSFQLNQ